MRRFKFRLQSVLNLKEKKLEDERLKLAGILSVLDAQKEVLEQMSSKKEAIESELNSVLENSLLDIQNVVSYRNFLNRLSDDIKMQFEIIKRTTQELEDQQQRVNEAYKDVKVLEKLKEKQYRNFLFEFEQSQTKELDDITISRYKRA